MFSALNQIGQDKAGSYYTHKLPRFFRFFDIGERKSNYVGQSKALLLNMQVYDDQAACYIHLTKDTSSPEISFKCV